MRILRVSSHPTKNFHGIGLHPHKISSTKRFKTFFSTFKISKQEEIIEVSNYDVFISDIYFDKRPTEGNKFKIIFFYLNRIIKLLRFSFRSIFLGANKSVQIVHIHSPMYILIALWGKLFNKLTCITYHGTDYLRIKNNKIYSFFCKKIIDVGFCISPHMIDKMKINHKEVYYIPNGIDSKIFKDLNYKRKKIFLAVGSLKKEKSYENLINAFSLLLNDYPEYKLNIAGEGPQKIKLIRIVKKLNISDNVIFLGNLNKKKLIEVYNRSEFFILSSSSEGFPKVVLEALFCGCKVISTNVGSVSTFLPESYIISNNSINNLYKHMVKIILEKNYFIDLNSLKKTYTWNNVILKYNKVYESNIN